MRHTVPDHHVKLVLVILNPQHHRHSLADLHNSGHLAGVGTLANLEIREMNIVYFVSN